MTADSDQSRARPKRTIISVDAMGGDLGPATVVAGISRSAKKNDEIGFILHGRKGILEPLVAKRKNLEGRIQCPQRDLEAYLIIAGCRATMCDCYGCPGGCKLGQPRRLQTAFCADA